VIRQAIIREARLDPHQQLLHLPRAEIGAGEVDRPLAAELRLGAGEELAREPRIFPHVPGERGEAG
jgi:hypothetical protein